jgi:cell division protein ZapA
MQSGGTQVNIFGQVYHVQGGEDPEHARQLAQLVDEKMNLIAAQVKTPDNFRVAVLAALHLADQCVAAQDRLRRLEAEVAEKTRQIVSLLDAIESEEAHATAFRAAG